VRLSLPSEWSQIVISARSSRRQPAVCVYRVAGEFSFLGALILEAVITELATLHRLSTASDVYLAGTRCVLVFLCERELDTSFFTVKLRSKPASAVKSATHRLTCRANSTRFPSHLSVNAANCGQVSVLVTLCL